MHMACTDKLTGESGIMLLGVEHHHLTALQYQCVTHWWPSLLRIRHWISLCGGDCRLAASYISAQLATGRVFSLYAQACQFPGVRKWFSFYAQACQFPGVSKLEPGQWVNVQARLADIDKTRITIRQDHTEQLNRIKLAGIQATSVRHSNSGGKSRAFAWDECLLWSVRFVVMPQHNDGHEAGALLGCPLFP